MYIRHGDVPVLDARAWGHCSAGHCECMRGSVGVWRGVVVGEFDVEVQSPHPQLQRLGTIT